jgi:hypothetical protein
LETEIWDREEIQKIIMYEPNKRNKAIIALSWDMDGRPHEVTLMQIKHVKLMERYGEAQVPHEGCGLTSSGDCQDDGLGLDEDPDDNAPDPNEDPDYD